MESKQAYIMFISLNWLKFSMLMLNLYARTFRFGFTFVMGSLHQLLQKKCIAHKEVFWAFEI